MTIRIPSVLLSALYVAYLVLPLQANAALLDLFQSNKVATKVATLNEDKMIWWLDFSPDGKDLAVTSPVSKTIHVWDWQYSRQVKSLEKNDTDTTSTDPIHFSPDGRLLVWCSGLITSIWNTTTWRQVHTIDGSNGLKAVGGSCSAAEFTTDGKLLAMVQDRLANQPGDNLVVYDV